METLINIMAALGNAGAGVPLTIVTITIGGAAIVYIYVTMSSELRALGHPRPHHTRTTRQWADKTWGQILFRGHLAKAIHTGRKILMVSFLLIVAFAL